MKAIERHLCVEVVISSYISFFFYPMFILGIVITPAYFLYILCVHIYVCVYVYISVCIYRYKNKSRFLFCLLLLGPIVDRCYSRIFFPLLLSIKMYNVLMKP